MRRLQSKAVLLHLRFHQQVKTEGGNGKGESLGHSFRDWKLSIDCWLTQQKPTSEGYQNRFAGTLTCVMPKHIGSTHRVVLPALCCQTLLADNRNNTLTGCWFNKHSKYMRDIHEGKVSQTPFRMTSISHHNLFSFTHFFCLCFQSKTCSLTCYFSFVAVLKSYFVIVGHITWIWT